MLNSQEILTNLGTDVIISPFNHDQLQPNSYDLCLGNWFVQLLGYKNGQPVFGDIYYFKTGERVQISEGTLLAMTLEVAGSRNWLVPSLKTKSSVRRNGIDVCASAGHGDIGYVNHWTVELTSFVNKGMGLEYPSLVVGKPFCQIVFEESGHLEQTNQYSGQYVQDDWPLCMLPKDQRHFYGEMVLHEDGTPARIPRLQTIGG